MPTDVIAFAIAVAVFAIAGVRVGMLVAGRLDRMTERLHEDADDGDD